MNYKGYNNEHTFYCTQCGRQGIPICRKKSRMKEGGHLKKLYCLNCKREVNHVECIAGSYYDAEMFRKEYQAGNFQKDGNRLLEWTKLHLKQDER